MALKSRWAEWVGWNKKSGASDPAGSLGTTEKISWSVPDKNLIYMMLSLVNCFSSGIGIAYDKIPYI